MPSTIDRITEYLGNATAALDDVNGSAMAATQVLAMLGWAPPPGVDDIGLAQLDVSIIGSRLDELSELRSQENTSDADLALAVAAVVTAVADAYEEIDQIVDSFQATPEYLTATGIRDQFFGRIADLLTIHAIGSIVPAALPVGALLGVFEFKQLPADPAIFQVQHVRQVVRWDRLATLFTDPTQLMREVYGWGTSNFRGNLLVGNIARVVEYISADAAMRAMPRAAEEQVARRQVPEADLDPAAQLFVSIDKGLGATAFDAGLTLYPLRPTTAGGVDGGIGLSPYVFGTTETSFPLSDNLSLVLSGAAMLQGGIALLIRAGKDPEFLTGLIDGGPAASGTPAGAFTMALRSADAAGGRQTLFSAPSRDPRRRRHHRWPRHHRRSQSVGALQAGRRPSAHRIGRCRWFSRGHSSEGWHHDDGGPGGELVAPRRPEHQGRCGPEHGARHPQEGRSAPRRFARARGKGRTARRERHRWRLGRREHRAGQRVGLGYGCRGGAEVRTGQPRPSRSERAVHAAQGHRPVRRCARRADRRRLPFQRRGTKPLRGSDAALDPRQHHAQSLRPHRDADARRQSRLLADRLHHRRRLPPDPAAARIPAAGYRRHGRREPHASIRMSCVRA